MSIISRVLPGTVRLHPLIGAIVSLADKIDTIVGCFSIGIIPTGSQDPYALRRQAAGIVQIILAHGLKLPLDVLFDLSLAVHSGKTMKREASDIRIDLYEFFALRVKNVLSEQGTRYDVVDAVMASGYKDLTQTVNRAAAVTAAAAGNRKEDFKNVVDALNRVCNLASKAASNEVKPELFIEEAEGELYRAWQSVSDSINTAVDNNDSAQRNCEAYRNEECDQPFFRPGYGHGRG